MIIITGELPRRISGSLKWIYESDDSGTSASAEVLTAFARVLNISPAIHKFEGYLELEPSEEHGNGALAISKFQSKLLYVVVGGGVKWVT